MGEIHLIPLKIDAFQKGLRDAEMLSWLDILVLCTVKELQNTDDMVKTSEIVDHLKVDRGRCYRSVRRLQKLGYLSERRNRITEPSYYFLTGQANLKLHELVADLRNIVSYF